MTRAVDVLLPEYDVHEVHRRVYAADAVAVRAALEGLRVSDLPVTRVLMAVRGLGTPATTAHCSTG